MKSINQFQKYFFLYGLGFLFFQFALIVWNFLEYQVTNSSVLFALSLGCLSFLAVGLGWLLWRWGYKQMLQEFSAVLTDTEKNTEQLKTVFAQTSNLKSTSQSNAASMQQTVASIEELNSMVKLNSDHASQAAALSNTSKQTAESGALEIKSLSESMQAISQSSQKIEEINNVIDDIAFQTNLLALNAAVEAARAGEQGRGFAVVAEAVRSLALRTSVAAKDINQLIKESVDRVHTGTTTAEKSRLVFNKIVEGIAQIAALNQDISMASSEQTTGLMQISKAMNQMDASLQSQALTLETLEQLAKSGENNIVTKLSTPSLGVQKNIQPAPKPAIAAKSVSNTPQKTTLKVSPKVTIKADPKPKKIEPLKVKTLPKSVSPAAVIPFDDDPPIQLSKAEDF